MPSGPRPGWPLILHELNTAWQDRLPKLYTEVLITPQIYNHPVHSIYWSETLVKLYQDFGNFKLQLYLENRYMGTINTDIFLDADQY